MLPLVPRRVVETCIFLILRIMLDVNQKQIKLCAVSAIAELRVVKNHELRIV